MRTSIGYESPLGVITLASADGVSLTGARIEGLVLAGDLDGGPAGPERDDLDDGGEVPEILQRACDWLDRYFAGARPDVAEIPLDPPGTAFRRDVWRAVAAIPNGQVATYGEVAADIARERGIAKMSARAVGGAASHNPIPIFIPCHRVVAANGLGGYGNCLRLKVELLQHEGVDLTGIDLERTGL